MTKKQLLTTLTVSTLLLSQAGLVSADEVTPTDPSQPVTEVVTPTVPDTPVNSSTDQPTSPEEPNQPLDPTQPSTGDETTPTDPSQPANVLTQPSENPKPSEPETQPEVNDKDTTPVVETPKEEPKTPTTPTAPKEGEASPSTGQVVSTVSPEAPVETATGVSIVSTKEGKVLLSDGSEVAPETIGAKTNEDKTITVTKKDGSKVTLPHTGDTKTLGLSLLGALMALAGALVWKQKKVQNN
ncbi:TPA: LPXTG cell wall anchor domain-containing protein [Streptococcus equi subsp. zooepidemicus]|nr:LPXTG cell wall anchor domain-containing protein [Streptococcus equi subsp. zooepidemicus]